MDKTTQIEPQQSGFETYTEATRSGGRGEGEGLRLPPIAYFALRFVRSTKTESELEVNVLPQQPVGSMTR